MPRRKQDCPKRRDLSQEFPEDASSISNTKLAEPNKKSISTDNSNGPLDLSTKRKPQTNKASTDSIDQGPKRQKLDNSANIVKSLSCKSNEKPRLASPIFSPTAGYYPNPFPVSSFGPAFSFPSLSGSQLMPLRLPTCPASTSSTAVTQTLLQPTFPVPTTPKNSKTSAPNDSLDKLSDLVQTVGSSGKQRQNGKRSFQETPSNDRKSPTATSHDLPMPSNEGGMTMQELWWKYMKKEESAELKRINEAKQIFTCLQCHQSFQSMDQLVKHMEVTQHFTNVPKHYSWSLQYARQKMRQMKLKLKYSERMMYFCHLCVAPFTVAVHQHFSEVHDMHNPVDNMNFVQIVMVNGGEGARLKPSSDANPSSTLERRTPTPGSSCGSSDCSSPAFLSPTSKPSQQTVFGAFKQFVDNSNKSPSNFFLEKNLVKKQEMSSSDNLLLKMEELVKSAVDQTYEKSKKLNSEDSSLPLPPSKFFSAFSKKKA